MKYICKHCNGYGSSLQDEGDTCVVCQGKGVVGQELTACVCDGTNPDCHDCHGTGAVRNEADPMAEVFFKDLPKFGESIGEEEEMEPTMGEPAEEDAIGPEDVEWPRLPGNDYRLS